METLHPALSWGEAQGPGYRPAGEESQLLQENGPSLLSPRRDVAVSQGNQEPRVRGPGVLGGTRALEQNAADSQASPKPSR